MQQRNGTEPLLQDNSITVNSPISITIEMKRRFVRNLFSRASSTRISHPSNRKWDRLVVRDRPDPSRWTKGQAETRGRGRETSGMRVNGNLDGDVSTTERRQKRRANEISAFLKKKKKKKPLQPHKTIAVAPSRDPRDQGWTGLKSNFPSGGIGLQVTTVTLSPISVSTKQFRFNLRSNGPTIVPVENERRGLAAAQQEAHLSARKIERDANGSRPNERAWTRFQSGA